MKYFKYFLFLILLIPFINVKAFTLKNKYMNFETYGSQCIDTAPLSCNSMITTNPNGQITLADSNYLKQYYFLYQDTYNGTSSNPLYFIYTQDTPFYAIVYFVHGSLGSTYSSIYIFSQKIEITQSEYNSYKNNGYRSQLYYDNYNNKYYFFTNEINNETLNVPKYIIRSNGWQVNPAGNTGTQLLAQNIDEVYYFDPPNYVGAGQTLKKLPPVLDNNFLSYNVTFHLNGGTAIYQVGSILPRPSDVHTSDFTIQVHNKDELDNYLMYLSVKSDTTVFNAWYSDSALTQPYNFDNSITSDINLYASYQFISMDSLLSEINFNEFTFPSDKQYAVLSVEQDFSKGMYIGLGLDYQFLDFYTYDINNSVFENGSTATLSSIGSKNNFYYYYLGQFTNDTAKVIVLDKGKLIKLGVDNVVQHFDTFRISENVYVYFTNDLTQVSYYIPSNNGSSSQLLENKDISANYDYTQKFILTTNTDLASLLLGLSKESDFSIFNYFTQLWYKFRAYKIYSYFMFLFISGIVVAIIKGASRH